MRTPVAVLAAMLTFTAAAETFRVSGTVVDSESGRPLNRTRVVLSGDPVRELTVVTTADGRFSFDVPKGKYMLRAAHRDWGDTYGRPVPGSDSGSAIVAGPDCDTTQLLFRFRAPAAIHGKVVDESGEPIPSATVELFRQSVVDGRKRLTSLGRAESHDFGDYSWSSLAAGTYYLAAGGEPWYFSDLFMAKDRLTEAGTPPVPYLPTYFPGAVDPRAASPVVLRPGAEFRADFTLRPSSGANLRFVCAGSAPCGGSLKLYAIGPGRAEALVRSIDLTEAAVIPAVPAGRYVLRYTGTEGSMRKAIDVGGGDITVEIQPKPTPTLAGRVIFLNPAERPRHTLYVNLADDDTAESVAVVPDPDGRFSWPAVTTARVRLFLSGSDGFFIARMSVEGAPVRDGIIDLADGAAVRVDLIASSETGRLIGFVKEKDEPAPGVLVVLAPGAGSTDPHRYLTLQTASDGSFECPNVPAGDYVLFAVNNLEFEYSDSDAVLPYLASGKRVRIEPHGTLTESIGLAQAGHK
jgi:hypothetical protein